MKSVLKYTLNPFEIVLALPVGAEILSGAFQGEDLQLWALVDYTGKPIEEIRSFEVYPTGQSIPERLGCTRLFVCTVFKGSFVFHIFENVKDIT